MFPFAFSATAFQTHCSAFLFEEQKAYTLSQLLSARIGVAKRAAAQTGQSGERQGRKSRKLGFCF